MAHNHTTRKAGSGTPPAGGCPPAHSFTAEQVADLAGSGISPEVAAAAGWYCEADPVKVADLLNWAGPAKALGPCVVIPYHGPDGRPTGYHRLKPTHPRAEKKKGGAVKAIKYEAPRGAPNRVYVPPGTRRHLNDPTVRLLITEGEKKSLCADRRGFACVSIPGVWAWAVATGGAKKGLIPDLSAVKWKGRPVVVLFDSDAATNPKVRQAEAALVEALRRQGAEVRVVRLPAGENGEKQGLDDYLVRHGKEGLNALLDATANGTPNPPMCWKNPARLADGFAAEHTLRVQGRTAFLYARDRYRVVGDPAVEDLAWGACEAAARKEYDRLRQADPAAVVPAVTTGMAAALVRAVRSRVRLPESVRLDSWIGEDRGPVLAVRNGLLRLPDRELRPHSPDWFSTAALPVAFDPAARPPARWLRVLNDLLPAEGKCDTSDRILTLQEVFGVCLDRNAVFKHLVALVGDGDNGKSVVLAVLRSLLGNDNVSSASVRRLTTERFEVFQLFGRLANISGDEGYFESADESTLKALTGEDPVTFEQKHKDGFTDVNRAKMVFSCNTLPRFSDRSDALWNRLVVLPFSERVADAKKNPDLLRPDHWRDELPGVLNWALDGLDRYRASRRLTLSLSSVRAGDEARLDAQHHRRFLLENYQYAPNEYTLGQRLYDEYRAWMERQGLEKRTVSQPVFVKEIPRVIAGSKSAPRRVGDAVVRVWEGVGHRPDPL
jgi:putative DNA primase/helicase